MITCQSICKINTLLYLILAWIHLLRQVPVVLTYDPGIGGNIGDAPGLLDHDVEDIDVDCGHYREPGDHCSHEYYVDPVSEVLYL